MKFTQASRNFIAVAKADSAALEQQSEDSDGMTLAQMAALYDGHPGLKRAITSAGMTTREYVTFIMSMFQAGMAAWMVEQQGGKFDKVPAGMKVVDLEEHADESFARRETVVYQKAISGSHDTYTIKRSSTPMLVGAVVLLLGVVAWLAVR